MYIYDVYDISSVRAGAAFVDRSVYAGFTDNKLIEYGLGDRWRAWSTNYDWLTRSLTPNESFWATGERPCEVDWECTVYKVAKRGRANGSSNIKLLLDTPYVEDQTLHGLWPNPVSVIIPKNSDLAATYGGKNKGGGLAFASKGLFLASENWILNTILIGTIKASGIANNMASAACHDCRVAGCNQRCKSLRKQAAFENRQTLGRQHGLAQP